MIIDLPRFVANERPYWAELEKMLDAMEAGTDTRMDIEKLERFHYLG